MLNKDLIALIPKASGQLARQPQRQIDLAQAEHPTVRGKSAARKIGHYFPPTQLLKKQRLVLTLCPRRSGGWLFHLAQSIQALGRLRRFFVHSNYEISGLAGKAEQKGASGAGWRLEMGHPF